jgi:hypothetical protein
MHRRKILLLIAVSATLVSCWRFYDHNNNNGGVNGVKVMGYKPIYQTESVAKQVLYTASPRAVVTPGNIYAFQNYIFQIEPGFGIHVIDNTTERMFRDFYQRR